MLLKYLLEKEFKQLFRNSFMPKIIIMMPIMMMLVMPWAANQEVKNINLSVIDHSHSSYSQKLIEKITASEYFKLADVSPTFNHAMTSMDNNGSDIILEIPFDFERDMVNSNMSKVSVTSNAVNGTKGSLSAFYLSSILSDYGKDLYKEHFGDKKVMSSTSPSFQVVPQYKFNPTLDYKKFMVPALMVMLITMLAGFLPALNIVSEKEIGTIEQINVTPVSRITFILAKLIPFWCVGFGVLTVCLTLAYFVYGFFPVGSLITIYVFATIYILVVSGMGLVISNYSDTMQQAMFVMFFFIMILILMSGLFTPIASMPDWAQMIAACNPLKYFMQVMRMVFLKGSSFSDLSTQFAILCGFAIALNSWAIISYRKKS